jgi:hypothetical protein
MARRDDHVRFTFGDLARHIVVVALMASHPTVLDRQIAPFRIAQLLQSSPEGVSKRVWTCRNRKENDPPGIS